MRKIPRRCERHHAFAWNKVRSGDRHGSAEAIADECNRFADAAQQREQQVFDMPSDAQLRARVRTAPVEQERSAVHPRNGASHRRFRVEIEDPRRIDQRRDEHRGWAFTPVIAQASPADTGDFRHRRRP